MLGLFCCMQRAIFAPQTTRFMRKITALAILSTCFMQASAQVIIDGILPVGRDEISKYIQVGVGVNRAGMRDFATSPLTYKGLLMNYSLTYVKSTEKRDVQLSARFNHGALRYKREEFFPVKNKAAMYVLFLEYSRLYTIRRWNDDRWNFKAGGTFNTMFDVRVNEDLMNAGVGYEMFNTIFLSARATRTFVRTEHKEKQFLFIKYKRKPRVQQLSYRLNVPVMNNNLRNGFAYIGNEGLNTTPLFKEYQYKQFNGVRFSSELAYTVNTYNGNKWRVSYLWDAYAAGKDFQRFEMANHILEFSLLYRIK